jgi:hypothetical protein
MKEIKLTPDEVRGILAELAKIPLGQSLNLYRFFEQKLNAPPEKTVK